MLDIKFNIPAIQNVTLFLFSAFLFGKLHYYMKS